MSRFLRLAVTETLAGRSERLKEYVFGVEVFDRGESFDPAIDPIVRVEAGRLRRKLERYYKTEGRHDDIAVRLPKGSYVPSFEVRSFETREPSSAKTSVAVLPFVDLGMSPDGSFGDGLTWELIHGLTRIAELSVVAWNSAAQLREDASDARRALTRTRGEIETIRTKLKVDAILVGSVRRFADRLRVVAQLIDTASGVYLWSETYDRAMEETADIQQEISQAMIAKLRLQLAAPDSAKRTAAYNPEAYQIYLRGRGQWNRRTEAGLREGLESFRKAAALDPGFALAYAGIADAYTLLAEFGMERPADATPRARTAALRALEIDPSLGEAYSSLALLLTHEWKWKEAEAHFRRALDLNPGNATTHYWFACDLLTMRARLEEAEREMDIALALDPLSSVMAEGSGYVLTLQRRYEESRARFEALIRADPSFHRGHTSLGRVFIQLGCYDTAIEKLEQGRSLAGNIPTILGAMGQAYGLSGRPEKARQILSLIESASKERQVPCTCFALTYIGLGELDRAIQWLETGADRRENNVNLIGVHPAYDGLRSEPRFGKLLERLGLKTQALINAESDQAGLER